ncbi:unnamed protein product [Amaranthus hypochondriacus]
MKGKNPRRKPTTINNKGKKNSTNQDSFFKEKNSKKRRKIESEEFDAEIDSDDASDDEDDFFVDKDGGDEKDEHDELEDEGVEEKRRRLGWELVEKYRKFQKDEQEQMNDDVDSEREDRDSRVASILQQKQLEDSGRVRRVIASKLRKPEDNEEPQLVIKHRQSVTAVALSDDDRRGFSASKDGCITHWDVEIRKAEKYLWPTEGVLKSHGMQEPKKRAKHSTKILDLAVSSDGRYLATGGLDRHVHIWDTRTREHIKAFPGHREPVSCLAFRQGTAEIFSGSFDRTVKIWNAEDKAYITTLFGHQSEVLSIDCLRKERALTVGRDRTMQLFKVPEESHLVFRSSASSLECGCFVGDDEFLSGSDDGSIELWSILRKKPVSIVRNAHVLSSVNKHADLKVDGRISNGHFDGSELKANTSNSTAQSWVSSVTVCRNSDLAASGAGNGCVQLWSINSDNKGILPLFSVPLVGYVNSLAIAKSGRFLIAGIGQEPRLGRWDRNSDAKNGVALQSFEITS